jgi:hypothetical protein
MRHAVAQQPEKTKRIALVASSTRVSDMRADKNWLFRAFFEELNRLGFIEGQNLVVERYSAEGRRERHVELAREVVGTHPDVIAALSGALALAFKAATTEIPIVTNAADPVAQGLVQSLAHPETSPVRAEMLAYNSMRSGSSFSKSSCQNCPTFFTLDHNRIGKDSNLACRSEQERSARALP